MSTFGRATRFSAIDDVPASVGDTKDGSSSVTGSPLGSDGTPRAGSGSRRKYRMSEVAGIVSRVAAVRRLPHLRGQRTSGNGGSPTSRAALNARRARTSSTSSVGSLRRSASRLSTADRPASPFQATAGGMESILKRIVALEARRQELMVELDMHTRQQQILEKQRDEYRSAIASTQQEIAEREGAVEVTLSKVEDAERRIKELTSAHQHCEAEIQKLRTQVGTLADLVRDLTGQVDSRKQELQARRAAINALVNEQKDVETQRQAEKAAIAEFKRETAMLEEEASQLDQKLHDEELALRQTHRETAELKRSVAQARAALVPPASSPPRPITAAAAAEDGVGGGAPSLWSPPAGAGPTTGGGGGGGVGRGGRSRPDNNASERKLADHIVSPVAADHPRRVDRDSAGGKSDEDVEEGKVGDGTGGAGHGFGHGHGDGARSYASSGDGARTPELSPPPARRPQPVSAFRQPSPIVHPRVVAAGGGGGGGGGRRPRADSTDSAGSRGRVVVDSWRLGDQIGEGAFSRVFVGLNEATGEFIAVKELKEKIFESGAENLDSSRARRMKRLEDEIKLMERLHHPNIVSYLGTSLRESPDGSSKFYILLEYVSGGSIAGVLRKFGSLAERTIRGYTRQTLSGLAYLHANGAVHRDVKGANLLVATDGTIRVADFGCSTVFRSETLSTDIPQSPGGASSARSSRGARDRLLGSIPWMAPEALKQLRSGRKSDIWSLGCTVVEMATGKRPWHHIDHVLTLLFHVATTNASPQVPDGLSDECLDFLSHCFDKDPEARWSAEELLGHPFVQDVEPGTGETPSPEPGVGLDGPEPDRKPEPSPESSSPSTD